MEKMELPKGWATADLSRVVSKNGLISDGDWVESKDQDANGSVRLIQLADIGDGEFRNRSSRFMNTEATERLNCTFLQEGDVLVARMPDPLGRACIFPKINQDAVTVVDVCLVRVDSFSAISNKLLMYLINSHNFRNIVAENASGTTRKRITRKKLEKISFNLPPLAEQKEIVRIVESHLKQVDQIKSRLDALPKILEQFRQSVLASAVSGRLTKDWRVKRHVSSCWLENSSFLGELIELAYGKSLPKKSRSGDGYPVYGSNGEVGLHNQYLVEGPFIIVGRKGSYGEIVWSKKSGWPIDTSYYVVLKEKSNLKFVFYLLKTLGLNQLNRSTAIPGLNRNDAYEKTIYVPSIEEQKEIVKRVESLFAIADQIESKIKNAQERVNLLTQSILAKAFRGEFTAKWREENPDLISGENSAEALLKRIKEAKKAAKKKK